MHIYDAGEIYMEICAVVLDERMSMWYVGNDLFALIQASRH